jgi:hypothetical protein
MPWKNQAPASQVLTAPEKAKLNAILDIHSVSSPLSLSGTDLQLLGLVIGTNVQAWDADLDTVAAAGFTGTGAMVRATSPTLVTPTLGAALAASIDFGNGAVTDLFGAAFTPTLSNITNVASSSQLRAVALRVNDVVAVGQAISVTPTAGSANTVVDSTLPYASAMTNAGDLIGVGSCFVSTSFVGVRVLGETTGDLARFNFTSNGTGAHTLFILYLYRIL